MITDGRQLPWYNNALLFVLVFHYGILHDEMQELSCGKCVEETGCLYYNDDI